MLTTRWILAIILALVGTGICVRLGIWQLDRLDQRRIYNARVISQIQAEPITINSGNMSEELFDMEFRQATVTGEFMYQDEVLLRNQVRDEQPGFHLLTPLHVTGTDQAVLVDRGWIPDDQADPETRRRYQTPGVQTISGVLRRPQTEPDFGGVPDPTLAPGETRLDAWNIINLERIARQTSLPLLPVYLQSEADANDAGLPFKQVYLPEISEGPHMGYAIQWFIFASILAFGFPFYLRKQLHQAG